MVRTQVSNFCIDYSHWYVARSNELHVSYGKAMKASKRVRLGLAMLRFTASLDLTFFCFFAAIIIFKPQPIVTSTIKHLMHRTKKSI